MGHLGNSFSITPSAVLPAYFLPCGVLSWLHQSLPSSSLMCWQKQRGGEVCIKLLIKITGSSSWVSHQLNHEQDTFIIQIKHSHDLIMYMKTNGFKCVPSSPPFFSFSTKRPKGSRTRQEKQLLIPTDSCLEVRTAYRTQQTFRQMLRDYHINTGGKGRSFSFPPFTISKSKEMFPYLPGPC